MTDSKQVAGLIGPTLIALTLSEALNFRIWATNIAPVTYLNGTLLFVAGLSIVRVHNRWSKSWPVLVTIMGWLAILGGLFRMFAPTAQQAGDNPLTLAVLVIGGGIGVLLTVKGYRREVGHTVAR